MKESKCSYGLPFKMLRETELFDECPADATAEQINVHLEVYLLMLLGGIMFCSSTGSIVEPHILWMARDMAARPFEACLYSWGSAVLAWTYRALCTACRSCGAKSKLFGCPLLLQLWSWTYLPICRPVINPRYYPIHVDDTVHPLHRPSMGYQWLHGRVHYASHVNTTNYNQVVQDLDFLQEDCVDWEPYSQVRMMEVATGGQISASCTAGSPFWLTKCFLLYMHAVEVYSPERVLRQFGFEQMFPLPPPRDAGEYHGYVNSSFLLLLLLYLNIDDDIMYVAGLVRPVTNLTGQEGIVTTTTAGTTMQLRMCGHQLSPTQELTTRATGNGTSLVQGAHSWTVGVVTRPTPTPYNLGAMCTDW